MPADRRPQLITINVNDANVTRNSLFVLITFGIVYAIATAGLDGKTLSDLLGVKYLDQATKNQIHRIQSVLFSNMLVSLFVHAFGLMATIKNHPSMLVTFAMVVFTFGVIGLYRETNQGANINYYSRSTNQLLAMFTAVLSLAYAFMLNDGQKEATPSETDQAPQQVTSTEAVSDERETISGNGSQSYQAM